MKRGKAVGPDDIPVEVWKCLGEAAVEFLASLFNRVLESERMPEEWRRSVLVPIFKNKGDVQSCSNYRGIKLMSHTMKVGERVVEARLRKVVEICEQQYGFMPRKSTTDAIFALRILMEKYRDGQRELHCVFVDLEKAYDRVPREELWYCMRKSGVAEKYVRVVQDMYERSRTVVRCAVGQTEEFNVEVGLHQGSALSPFLFAIVMDQLSEEVRQESPWTMMFADDIVICSESREQVEENLERWRFALERRGMKVSRSKTEYMCVNEREGSGTVRLQGEEVKKVQEFKYLGSTVQSNGECGKEVKKRVQAGWNGWRKVSGVLCDQKISARIKGKVYRTVVRPAMLYGLETVSLRKRQESELEECEREQEAHRLLKSEDNEMMETLTNSEKFLMVSLAEAEEKHQKAVKTIAQLENEKSNLINQVGALKDTVEELEEVQAELRKDHDEIMDEYDQLWAIYNILQAKHKDMEEKLIICEELIIVEKLESHHAIKMERDELKKTLTANQKLLKIDGTDPLAWALVLGSHWRMRCLKELFFDGTARSVGSAALKSPVLRKQNPAGAGPSLDATGAEKKPLGQRNSDRVCEQSTEPVLIRASVILEDQKTVSWAEVVEKHQKYVETITQLEKEKSNLTDQVKAQKDAHRHLKSEYQEMIETLTNSEKLLKVSLAQAEEKHQKDVETITQLEKEKFNLTDQVKTLQDTVEDLGSQLCDTHLQCDELKNECEREQDVHRLLKSEYQEMMETLTNSEKLLKVSLTEAEGKHQKAVETIAQLEKEKSNLMYQVGALKDIREDLEYVQTELCEERDKIMDEYTGLKDTHNILQDKHKETEEKLKRFEELLMECEREQEAHRLLKSEDEEMMETLTNSEKFLMVSLAEAEEKHQKAVKTIAQLENEKSNLINQVGALKDTVEELEEVQAELRKDHDEIMDEYDQLWATHNILQAKHKDMEKKLIISEELIIVEKLESHHAIKMERDELKKTLTSNQKLLKKLLLFTKLANYMLTC
ncbi:hypothetical protein QTP86_001686 [Hemibagrus guttatus]|nr:hypothetical protein QTP86_001686 [Hemibagrus guttatus]